MICERVICACTPVHDRTMVPGTCSMSIPWSHARTFTILVLQIFKGEICHLKAI
jgi:hypothetical protein